MKHLDCFKFLSIDHTFSTLKSREFRVVRVRSISQHLHSIVNEKQTGRFIKQMKRGHFIYRVSWYNDISIGHLCIPLIKTAIQIVDSQSTNFNQSWTWPKKKKKRWNNAATRARFTAVNNNREWHFDNAFFRWKHAVCRLSISQRPSAFSLLKLSAFLRILFF